MAAVRQHQPIDQRRIDGSAAAIPEFLHDDGITYCIRRETLEQDFTIYEKRERSGLIAALIKP